LQKLYFEVIELKVKREHEIYQQKMVKMLLLTLQRTQNKMAIISNVKNSKPEEADPAEATY
jgi:hypothetical protein